MRAFLTSKESVVYKGQGAASALRKVANRIAVIADSLNDDESLIASHVGSVSELSLITNRFVAYEEHEPMMLRLAEAEYAARRTRSKFIDSDLLGEPAWDILLDLVIHRIKGKRVSVTSLCIAAAVPPTTGLRWISQLQGEGLLERQDSEADRRRAFISLTDEGWDKMCSFFLHQMSLSPAL